MRHPSLVLLSQDHHHGLALALRCRKQALGQIRPVGLEGLRQRATEFQHFFTNNLAAHFRAEEQVLFPQLRIQVPESERIIEQLIREHEQIRSTMPQLQDEFRLGKTIFDLGDLLERHIRKEERELFPLFGNHLGAKEAAATGEAIKKILNSGKS
jgi:hemerythrin-like domain-containing protein